jgi:hypothetical protein
VQASSKGTKAKTKVITVKRGDTPDVDRAHAALLQMDRAA